MKCSIKPNTLLATTSIVLAVCIWPIICYCFVLNCMDLMSTYTIISRSGFLSEDDNGIPISNKTTAMTITFHAIQIATEAAMVVSLVFQYMSAFDYLTGPEYETHWKICSRNIFCLNSIIFAITCCLFLINYLHSSSSNENSSHIELLAIAVNFIFLFVAVIVDELDENKRGFRGDVLPSRSNSLTPLDNNATKKCDKNSNYNLNINSFLDETPISEEKDKKIHDIVL